MTLHCARCGCRLDGVGVTFRCSACHEIRCSKCSRPTLAGRICIGGCSYEYRREEALKLARIFVEQCRKLDIDPEAAVEDVVWTEYPDPQEDIFNG